MDREPFGLGWLTVRFNQIADNIVERIEPAEADTNVYVGLEHLDPDSLRLRRWGTPADVDGTKLRFYPGDVIFGRRRAYQRKLAVADCEGICSAHAMVLRAKPDVCLPEFLPFFLQSDRFFERAMAISVGSLSPTINWTTLAVQEFQLPPLDEQLRIGEILWAVEGTREAMCRSKEALFQGRQAFIADFVARFVATHRLVELDSIIEPSRPITYGILKPGLYFEGGIPVVKVKDYPDGVIELGALVRTSPEIEHEYRRSRLRAGDILLSIRGTIGRVAEVPPELEQANITQDTARLSVSPEHSVQFVRFMLESEFVQQQARVATTGLAVKGINIGEVRKLKLPIPPRSDQDEVGERLRLFSVTSQRLIQHIDKCMSLKNQLLQAFIVRALFDSETSLFSHSH